MLEFLADFLNAQVQLIIIIIIIIVFDPPLLFVNQISNIEFPLSV